MIQNWKTIVYLSQQIEGIYLQAVLAQEQKLCTVKKKEKKKAPY